MRFSYWSSDVGSSDLVRALTPTDPGVTGWIYSWLVSVPVQEPLFDPLELSAVTVDTSLLASVELHPAVAAWFRERFPQGPTPAQEAAWPPIAAGEHTLVAAPTGSGKTLAGFLMAINRLYLAFARGQPAPGTRLVHLYPLNALAVHIPQHLERPTAGLRPHPPQAGLATP